jgi:hypothetical protein
MVLSIIHTSKLNYFEFYIVVILEVLLFYLFEELFIRYICIFFVWTYMKIFYRELVTSKIQMFITITALFDMNLGDDSRILERQQGHDPRGQYIQTDSDDAL